MQSPKLPHSVFRRESDGKIAINLQFSPWMADRDFDFAIKGNDLCALLAGTIAFIVPDLPAAAIFSLRHEETLLIFYQDAAPIGELLLPPLGRH